MKAFVFIFSLLSIICGAQNFKVDTLLYSGDLSRRINVVIVAEGYTATELPQFMTSAQSLSTYLFNNTPPFSLYKNYFNVFTIGVVSSQSGITHPATATDVSEPVFPAGSTTNYFNTTFDYASIHRLMVATSTSSLNVVLSNNFPNYDIILLLGNSTEYGGSGGNYITTSVNSNSREIAAHEMGHTFAGLADEYWAGTPFAAEKPNMTADNSQVNVKWSSWLGLNGVGIYPYGTTAPLNAWFRPHQNCKMRYLNRPFCSVCSETIIEKIHALTNPINSYTPSDSSTVFFTTTAESQLFKINLIKPNPNTLKTVWELNTTIIAKNIDSILITPGMLGIGNNSLLFTIIDTTVLSKDIAHTVNHSYYVLWNINNTAVGIKEIKPQLEYSIFPNPTSDMVNLKYTLLESAEINISITDISGKTVINTQTKNQTAGDYKTDIDSHLLKAGNYFLVISINNQPVKNQIVILN